MPTDFEEGVLVGLLVGEGHFGGDGRQPHVTLRMSERHEALFRWIERTFPGGRLYGPYDHGGRRYYQWMARGPYLRDTLVPLLEERLHPRLDRYGWERFDAMRAQYRRQLSTGRTRADATAPLGQKEALEGSEEAAAERSDAPPTATSIFAALRERTAEDASGTRRSGP